jgi:hypothetical protein
VTRLPSETNGAGLLRDTFGRRELTVRGLNDPLDIGDVPGVGTVFDGDGREHVVITGRGGTVLSVDGDAAIVDAYKLGVRASNAGTTNRDLIANAVAALPAGIPAKIVLPGDVFSLAPLTLPERARTITGRDTGVGGILCGAGTNATLLRLPDGTNADLLTIAGLYWTVRDVGLDGNRENNAAGSCLRISKPRATVENLVIGWAFEHGIVNEGAPGAQAHAPWLTDVKVRSCHGNGIYVKGVDAPDMQATNIWVGACDGHGVLVESPSSIWTNVHPWGNGGDGFRADNPGGGHGRLVGVYSETNVGHGVRFSNGAGGWSVVGGQLWKNTQHGAFCENLDVGGSGRNRTMFTDLEVFDNVGYGIVGQNSSYGIVRGCNFYDTQATKTQGYGVQTNGTSDRWLIAGNIMVGVDLRLSSKNLVGSNNVLRDNVESITQNRRTITASGSIFGSDPQLIAITDTTAARTLTLPVASGVDVGRRFTIKDETGGAATNNITVQRASTDTIDGAVSKVINTAYGALRVYSNGAAWFTE